MASVFVDTRRGVWWVKWKSPDGWRRDKLGKHPTPFPKDKPPKKPPDGIAKRAAPYYEREREARGGGDAVTATGLAGYFHAHAERFRKSRPANSARAFDKFARTFLAFCQARGVTTVQAVTRAVCRDYMESRLDKVCANSVKTERNYLAPVFSRAEVDGLVPTNSWRQAKPPGKATPSDPVFWSGEEVAKIARAAVRPWHADLIRLMANTGLRVSAALATEFGWFDLARGVIKVPKGADKGGKGYEVPMNSVAREIVERRSKTSEGSPFVFGKPGGGHYATSAFRASFAGAVVRAGVKPGTPHDLRHTFARSLCVAGVPINVVQSALGHSSLAMTQRYTDVTADTAKKFMEGFSVGGDASQG